MAHENGDRLVLGVTGHRNLAGSEEEVALAVRETLAEHQRRHGDQLVALSAIAAGADTLFAEAAISLGIPLEVILPFEGYESDFATGQERERYEALCAAAQWQRTLSFEGRSDEAYASVGRWIVDHSDHLVAVWDGMPARGPGGTGYVVAYARERGHPVTVLTPAGMPQGAEENSMEGGSATRTRPEIRRSKFEEYRTFIQSTEKLTDRRQLATQIWVTLHTLLFAALGFLLKETAVGSLFPAEAGAAQATTSGGQWVLVGSSMGPLLVLGLLSCVIWRKMLLDYRSLIGWRFEQLMEMERSPQLEGLHKIYNREWESFFGPEARRARISFTQLEALLPTVLIFVYLIIAAVGVLIGLGSIPS